MIDKTLLSESDLRAWAYRTQQEVFKENGEAEKKLKAKCRWERMSRIKIVLEFGDPREWDDPPTHQGYIGDLNGPGCDPDTA